MDEHDVRVIVREEIASLAGKALRRTQDRNYTRSSDRNMAIDVTNDEIAEFRGEVLAEYGTEIKDGEKTVGWPVPGESVEIPPEASSK